MKIFIGSFLFACLLVHATHAYWQQEFIPSPPNVQYGIAKDLDGNLMAVSSFDSYPDANTTIPGQVWVYRADGDPQAPTTEWPLASNFNTSYPQSGYRICLDGNHLAVVVREWQIGYSGIVMYNTTDNGTTWSEVQTINTTAQSNWIDCDDGRLVFVLRGDLVIYVRDADGMYQQEASVAPPASRAFSNVAISGTTIAAGDSGNQGQEGGIVVVLGYNGTHWAEQGSFVEGAGNVPGYNLNNDFGDQFGASVSLSATGDLLAIGCPRSALSTISDQDGTEGRTYVYKRTGSSWSRIAVAQPDLDLDLRSGEQVAIDNSTGTVYVASQRKYNTYRRAVDIWKLDSSNNLLNVTTVTPISETNSNKGLSQNTGSTRLHLDGRVMMLGSRIHGSARVGNSSVVTTGVAFLAYPFCGDEVVQEGEECDDGNFEVEDCPVGNDNCTTCARGCALEFGNPNVTCGDGYISRGSGEECEDDDMDQFDGCTTDCTISTHFRIEDPGDGGGDAFGHALAAYGKNIAVGAPGSHKGGSVYTFQPTTTAIFGKTDTIDNPDLSQSTKFGSSMAMFNNTMVIGAPGSSSGQGPPGVVHVYTLGNVGVWEHQAVLRPSQAGAGEFGFSVDISSDYIVVGAPGGSPAGGVDVFNATSYEHVQRVYIDSLWNCKSRFGSAVAIEDDVIVVGQPYSWCIARPAPYPSTAHEYVVPRAVIYYVGQQKPNYPPWYSTGVDATADGEFAKTGAQLFGSTMSMSNGILAVGAPGAIVDGVAGAGSVSLFQKAAFDQPWSTLQTITSGTGTSRGFGGSVSLSSLYLVIGGEVSQTGGLVHMYKVSENFAEFDQLKSPDAGTVGFGFPVHAELDYVLSAQPPAPDSPVWVTIVTDHCGNGVIEPEWFEECEPELDPDVDCDEVCRIVVPEDEDDEGNGLLATAAVASGATLATAAAVIAVKKIFFTAAVKEAGAIAATSA